ncbi:sensor of ECF-type sigma factor [Mangrovimonas spongiae]|uniref:Sensor of ECF-type sigma factor n=1 Tax=Mangrovimonas spongiae TaxID=2494697 RepID=A0A3R9USP7_9FLAO|nr:sensor of ECF-type sigma factor [Mangrovimonas spongiae]RSK39317.1 sensor of ECF-type sigma factor [Mangrovimonas spongiae]
MKKLLTYLLILGVSFSSIGQDKSKKEKIDALEIAYITEHLNFTKQEAQKFWPIYNTFEDKEDELRYKMRNKKHNTNFESLSEQDAKKLIADFNSLEEQMHNLRKNYTQDLLQILPAKKVLLLKKTEEEFRRKMFEEFKKRRSQNYKKRG